MADRKLCSNACYCPSAKPRQHPWSWTPAHHQTPMTIIFRWMSIHFSLRNSQSGASPQTTQIYSYALNYKYSFLFLPVILPADKKPSLFFALGYKNDKRPAQQTALCSEMELHCEPMHFLFGSQWSSTWALLYFMFVQHSMRLSFFPCSFGDKLHLTKEHLSPTFFFLHQCFF